MGPYSDLRKDQIELVIVALSFIVAFLILYL